MVEMDVEDYLRPVATAVRTHFVTAAAAARHMRGQASGGVILMFGGAADPPRGLHLGGLQTAFHAMEAMRRQLSSELAADGVRVITLKTSGVPEAVEAGPRRDAIDEMIAASTLLGRAATLEDVGNAAVFAASDRARSITAAAINISCGTFMD
jgi:NAD(P)-dependent dehydrogenase (short-subunit alcohol dehydrogenase family)